MSKINLSVLKYTSSHEWAGLQGSEAMIGITDHAQEALGDIVYIELPTVGTQVKQGAEVAVVESVKAAADIYAPLSGKVIEVNTALVNAPEGVNQDPYGKGWLMKIAISHPQELESLLTLEAYEAIASQGH